MSNSWFQFKKFRIDQGNCAMKITTDACIQGAWTPILPTVRNVLDIGAGTGLLSLMLAQRNADIIIDAVELNPAAASQAAQNINISPWADRINIICKDIAHFESKQPYDLIICNPPFFANSLLSPTHSKNLARHNVSLTSQQLLNIATSLLSEKGKLSLLLPYTEYLDWRKTALQCELYEAEILNIRHRPSAPVKRVVTILTPMFVDTPTINELTIQNIDGEYTDEFKKLLADFYLNL